MHDILDKIMIKQRKAHGHLLSPQCELHLTVYSLYPWKLYNSAWQFYALALSQAV